MLGSMSTEKILHDAQVVILHELLFKPAAGFAQLQKASGLASDHFNFHLKQLVEQSLVAKNADGQYALTPKGKEFSNRFDTEAKTVERQPKVAVLLIVERADGKIVAQQRLKQPFYGYWGRPTGKLRWGETILDGAARELLEETGLTATLTFSGVHHKMDYDESTKELLEDKLFFVVHGVDPRGELLAEFDGGCNTWMSNEELIAQETVFAGIEDITQMARKRSPTLHEAVYFYSDTQY